jgi:broad specificity polyphosphatase/5'/3'-nucleotidase SurE
MLGYREAAEFDHEAEDTDVFVLRKKRMVSVSPLSLDLTSRVEFTKLDKMLRKQLNTKDTE